MALESQHTSFLDIYMSYPPGGAVLLCTDLLSGLPATIMKIKKNRDYVAMIMMMNNDKRTNTGIVILESTCSLTHLVCLLYLCVFPSIK